MGHHDSNPKTKQEILETAMRLFAEKGLENVNVADVVKEVGVTRGAFYHYFKSREELISSVMYKSFSDNNPFILAQKQEGLNALEKLRYVFKIDLRPRLDMSDSLKVEMQEMADNSVVFKNELLSQVNVVAPHIEKLLLEGNEDGSLSVKYPKQVSQIISLLVSSWLSSFAFHVSYGEYADKVSFLEQLGEVLGVPFMDEELKELFLEIGRK
ncbi:TetR/AcrR family transcriptional regulator [Enterococcus larvae]|uniref:TetR/AcrR family transcriptional regulator n=1 Tax=Enterococcus larvae TaxID=2794352 RepID=UPI003F32536E